MKDAKVVNIQEIIYVLQLKNVITILCIRKGDYMSIVKQKEFINARALVDNILEDMELNVDSSSYLDELYGECKAYVGQGGVTDNLDRLFDYFYFNVYNIKDNKDFSSNIKKIIKSLGIDSYYLLEGIYVLNSYIVRECREYIDTVSNLSNEWLIIRWTANYFKLFLYYCFDICFGGKSISCPSFSCKYKELDDPLGFSIKKIKGFKDNLNTLLLGIDAIKNGKVASVLANGLKAKIDIEKVELGVFQKIRLKYDFIFLDHLVKKLLPEESSYYLSRFRYSQFIFDSIRSELIDSECNIELHYNFYRLLKKRAYLIPHSGISISPSSLGMSLDIFERQFNGDNHLVIISNFKDSDTSFFTVINLSKEYVVSNSTCLYDIVNFLYYFYKLDEYAVEFGDNYTSDPHLLLSYKTNNFLDSGMLVIKGTASTYTDFVVEVPYYWRYKGKARNPIKKKEFLDYCSKGSFEYISAFKRRLPSGSVASEKAKDLAKYYCIELEEGETLVSPFIRVR